MALSNMMPPQAPQQDPSQAPAPAAPAQPLAQTLTKGKKVTKPKASDVLNKSQMLDLKIAVHLGERLLRGGGLDVVEQAMKSSSNPSHVIGQFLMQLGQQMMEKMPHNIILSPRILLCHGGWLEQMSDMIQKIAHVPKQIMDQAEIFVASTAAQMGQAKQKQSGGAINGVQAPPIPSPGAPQGQPMPQQPQMQGGQ